MSDHEEHCCDECCHEHAHEHEHEEEHKEGPTMVIKKRKMGKIEKRSKKLMMKNDLKELPGITRIIFKRAGISFMVSDPEVYFNAKKNCYVVFGDFQPMNFPGLEQTMPPAPSNPAETAEEVPVEEKKEEVAAGLEEKDIETVMNEGKVSRERAIELLKEHGDAVEAILAASE